MIVRQTGGMVLKNLIAVVDGQGGGIGAALVERLKREIPSAHVRALGTNSAATGKMLRAGADDGATGENAVVQNVHKAAVVMGVQAILSPNALLGELTPRMAEAIGDCEAVKILIPLERCSLRIAVPGEYTLPQCLEKAVLMAKELIQEN